MNDLSVIELFLKASILVQGVMILLILSSVLSWTLILRKSRHLYKTDKIANDFTQQFWGGKDLNAFYNRLNKQANTHQGMENIFLAGYQEFAKLRRQTTITPAELVEGTERAMRVALHREIDILDRDLSTLATIGSVSPYIGLFGTVWGIMHSFHAIGGMEQVTLAMVAPGISEALIATAVGLFAAIPAVIGYNHYSTRVERIITRYDTFLDEFLGLLQRQAHLSLSAANPIQTVQMPN